MSCHRLAVACLDLHRSWLLLRLDRHGRTGSLSRSAIIGNRRAGRNTARLLRPPPERPVRRPPSYRRLTLPLLALASMIAGSAAAQSARPAPPPPPPPPRSPDKNRKGPAPTPTTSTTPNPASSL